MFLSATCTTCLVDVVGCDIREAIERAKVVLEIKMTPWVQINRSHALAVCEAFARCSFLFIVDFWLFGVS